MQQLKGKSCFPGTDPPPGIGRSLLGLVLIVVLPLIVFGGLLVAISVEQARRSVEQELINTANALRVAVDHQLLDQFAAMNILAADISLDSGDLAAFQEQARRALGVNPGWRNIGLVDPLSYRIVAGVPPLAGPAPETLAPASVAEVARSRKPKIVGTFPLSRISQGPIILLLVPVLRQDKVVYVLGLAIDPKFLSDLFVEQQLPPTWTGAVVDAGLLLAGRSRSPEQFIGKPLNQSLVEHLDKRQTGLFTALNQEGAAIATVFSRSAVTGWSVVLGVPAEVVEGPPQHTLHQLFGLGGALGAVTLLMAWLLARRLMRQRYAHEQKLQDGLAERSRIETQLQAAQRIAHLGSWEIDHATHAIAWSAEMFRIYGVPPDAAPNCETWRAAIHPADRALTEAAFVDTLTSSSPLEISHRVVGPDGRLQYLRLLGQTEFAADGTPLRSAGTAQDVSDAVRQQLSLEEAERRYRTVLEDQTELIARFRVDGTLLFVNEVYARYFGRQAADWIGKNWRPQAHPGDVPAIDGELRALTPAHPVVTMENRVLAASGEIRWLQFVNRGFFDEAGQLVEIQAVGRDITERRHIEQALQENERQLARVIEGSDQGFWDWELPTQRFTVSARFETMLGYAPGEMKLSPERWGDYVEAEDLARARLSIQRHLDGKSGSHSVELRCRAKSGEWRWVLTRGGIVERDPEGRPLRMAGTHTDITERKRLEGELARHRDHLEELVAARTAALSIAKEAAEAASRAKTTFLAKMSHELRTPLNGIMGMTEIALRRATDATQQRQLETVRTSSQHLLAVINDILDISRIEAERLTLEQTDFHLEEVLSNVGNLIGVKAAEKGLELVVDIDPALARRPLLGDPLRLAQILLNLLGNAIKFTPRGSVRIGVGIVEEGRTGLLIRFDVRDTGVGIAAEDQSRLFRAFEQADNSITRNYGGSGLGLAISRRLARMMGGEMGVESRPGEGSRFFFTARFSVAAAALPAPCAAAAPVAPAGPGSAPAGARLLLAEDDPINQEVARTQLTHLGFRLDVAADGAEVLRLVQRNRYDLILMDVQMPVMDGLEASRQIRRLPGGAAVPIIAMTASAFSEDRDRCFEAGMNDFLSKPVMLEALRAMLAKWLERETPRETPQE